MSLKLGKSFDRSYFLRIPIVDGFYNVGIFYNKKTTFLLFRIDPDFQGSSFKRNIKINMFKSLESSKFCETFVKLHNYRKTTLDIINQFEGIKDNYTNDVVFVLNETITLAKFNIGDRDVYDSLNIYGLTLSGYEDEFIFIIAERHNILKRLGRKLVRTTGLQIATGPSLDVLNDYNKESKIQWQSGTSLKTSPDKTIVFSELDNEAVTT